jgi:hypothetical protein
MRFYVVEAKFPKRVEGIDDPSTVAVVGFDAEEPDQRFWESSRAPSDCTAPA